VTEVLTGDQLRELGQRLDDRANEVAKEAAQFQVAGDQEAADRADDHADELHAMADQARDLGEFVDELEVLGRP